MAQPHPSWGVREKVVPLLLTVVPISISIFCSRSVFSSFSAWHGVARVPSSPHLALLITILSFPGFSGRQLSSSVQLLLPKAGFVQLYKLLIIPPPPPPPPPPPLINPTINKMLSQSLLLLASAALALGSPVERDIACRSPMADPPLPTTGGGKFSTLFTYKIYSSYIPTCCCTTIC